MSFASIILWLVFLGKAMQLLSCVCPRQRSRFQFAPCGLTIATTKPGRGAARRPHGSTGAVSHDREDILLSICGENRRLALRIVAGGIRPQVGYGRFQFDYRPL